MENVSVDCYDLSYCLEVATNDIELLKLEKQQATFLPTVPLELAEILLSYRMGMRVTEVMVFDSLVYGKTRYYVCPRCKITMEREFASFCDRCGQHLDWKAYRKATVIYPGRDKNDA